jgi:hypothetical protein
MNLILFLAVIAAGIFMSCPPETALLRQLKKIMALIFQTATYTTFCFSMFSACSSTDADTNKTDGGKTKNTVGQMTKDTFACPMHPEVTGKEGEMCPKCGMKLEHESNTAVATGNIKMKFATIPRVLKSNEEAILSFTPVFKDNDKETVPLDIVHEKKIHLIVVSNDLSYFDHIHPEMNTDGSYTVKHAFPAGGRYVLFADYKPRGFTHMVDKLDVMIDGNVPAVKSFATEKLACNADNYTVTLSPQGGKFVAKFPMHIVATVTQNGKAIDPNTMQNYLGAKAHMVILGLEDKAYMHVHPNVVNKRFDLHTTFEKPGTYRAWIQFQTNGKVHTGDMVIIVQEGA